MTIGTMDKNKQCRTCFVKNGTVILSSVMLETRKPIVDMLLRCIPELNNEITKQDCICTDCLKSLLAAYNFIESCISANNQFKRKLPLEVIDLTDDSQNTETDPTITNENFLLNLNSYSSPNKISNDTKILNSTSLSHPSVKIVPPESAIQLNNPEKSVLQIKIGGQLVTIPGSLMSSVVNDANTTQKKIFRIKVNDGSVTEINENQKEKLSLGTAPVFRINLEGKNVASVTKTNTNPVPVQKKLQTVNNVVKKIVNDVQIKREVVNDHDYLSCDISEAIPENIFPKPVLKKTGRLGSILRKELRKKKHQCILCNDYFPSLDMLTKHRKAEHKVGPFKCNKCDREFIYFKLLDRHQRSHSSQPIKDICKSCNAEFVDEIEFKEHLKIHPNFLCDQCGKSLSSSNSLIFHKKTHSTTADFMCSYCGQTFRYRSLLAAHMLIHNKGSFKCKICNKEFGLKVRLNRHLKTHDKTRQLPCEHCDRVFLVKSSLRQHIKLKHMKLKPYACEYCNMVFGRKDYLQKHIVKHITGPQQRRKGGRQKGHALRGPFPCAFCSKVFEKIEGFKLHLNTHYRVRKHKCSFCNLLFLNKPACIRHEKVHQTDDNRRFRCDICFKRLTTQSELEAHIETHNKRPKNYVCEVCNMRFARRYLLETHTVNEHTNLQEYMKNVEQDVELLLSDFVRNGYENENDDDEEDKKDILLKKFDDEEEEERAINYLTEENLVYADDADEAEDDNIKQAVLAITEENLL